MASRQPRRVGVAMLLALVPSLGACGSSSLSAGEFRARAGAVCETAGRRMARIPAPSATSGAAVFLERGVSEVTTLEQQLRRLRPPGALAGTYGTALEALSGQQRTLRETLGQLRAGSDPIIVVRALAHRLTPLERRGNVAWRQLEIPACVNL